MLALVGPTDKHVAHVALLRIAAHGATFILARG